MPLGSSISFSSFSLHWLCSFWVSVDKINLMNLGKAKPKKFYFGGRILLV